MKVLVLTVLNLQFRFVSVYLSVSVLLPLLIEKYKIVYFLMK